MMKFKYLIMILIMTIVFPTCVLAKGDVSVSNSKINDTIYKNTIKQTKR